MTLHLRPARVISTLLFATVLAAVTPACESSTGPIDPGGASYSVAFDPAQIIHATLTCDRYLSYAILSLGRSTRGFSLSINIMNDCTRGGGTWTYGGVYIEGQYVMEDTTLSFTPDAASTPPFVGSFDSTYVRLTLPPRTDSLAATPIPLRLGPRSPF
ncbi:MAG: hypothetical protein OER90_01350 [Gemmatimonadota bacterium]|nr:hypothetical protein [Gemmatimonadota bacterium]